MHRSKKGTKRSTRSKNSNASGALPRPRLPRDLSSSSTLTARSVIYPRMIKLDFSIAPAQYGVVTGATAVNFGLGSTNSTSTGNAFGLFSEYAIVGVRLHIRQITTASPQGAVWIAIDEKIATTPTAASMQDKDKLVVILSQNDAVKDYKLQWKAGDYDDLAWNASNSSYNAFNLKIFASTAATLTSATTASTILITGSMAFCFRGLN